MLALGTGTVLGAHPFDHPTSGRIVPGSHCSRHCTPRSEISLTVTARSLHAASTLLSNLPARAGCQSRHTSSPCSQSFPPRDAVWWCVGADEHGDGVRSLADDAPGEDGPPAQAPRQSQGLDAGLHQLRRMPSRLHVDQPQSMPLSTSLTIPVGWD